MEEIHCEVLVVGGGPGGYVAAIRAGQAGLDTVLVEADRLGGTCLIRGCIPSKALIEAAGQYARAVENASGKSPIGLVAGTPKLDYARTIAWKDGITDKLSKGVAGLLKAAGVRVITGWAVFENAKTCQVGDIRIQAENVILANGSTSVALPGLPFGGDILSSTEALDLSDIPKRLAVIGAGYIGVELGTVFAKLGAQVTFIEAAPAILPGFDKALVAPVQRRLKALGVRVHTNCLAMGFKSGKLTYKDKDGKGHSLSCDKVLVTVGRKPMTEGWGLETMGLDMAPDPVRGPFIRVDEKCATPMRGVYAIGDLVGEPMLAHKASAQGEMVAEILAGHKQTFAPAAIPAVCFSDPEIVSVGLSPAQAKESGIAFDEGKFRFAANGRALSLGADKDGGFVRVLARKDTGLVIGIQAVGAHISELAGEFALALEMCATLDDIAGTIHAHPTLGEAVMESAHSALGHPLHSV
ncbi:MAG TPA: dihydrolipoyl dehydrogenase [Hellea balneolensis]|uniref:Dihydrolipoyl dehydrogenase n=1 Tax=Hellea balneolensis TaxID=287478 RepID=A0A7V5NWL9_9PROT|nr:dihydrolipoyl dehydrogenase [Hellea balneolensis]